MPDTPTQITKIAERREGDRCSEAKSTRRDQEASECTTERVEGTGSFKNHPRKTLATETCFRTDSRCSASSMVGVRADNRATSIQTTSGRSGNGSRREYDRHSYEKARPIPVPRPWMHTPQPVASGFYKFTPLEILQHVS